MTKALRFSLCTIISATVLLSAAPATQAAINTNSLLKKIYKKSDDGDAGDIYVMIRRALENNPTDGENTVEKLIKNLQKNRDQLAFDVSEDDLDRVYKKLRRWLKNRPVTVVTGPITRPESGTQNR